MYTKSLTNYIRTETNNFEIGNVPIGSDYPIRVQTMTNTDTKDVDATLNQVVRSIETGADYVRVTTPTLQDVEATYQMQAKLRKMGYDKPIIADIHFNPKVANAVAGIVQKVRVNPGNFVKANKTEYSKKEYNEELQKIKEICVPLLEKCKTHNTSIRIGTNHGSLSQRIISKYGNTAEGLVQATLEYLEICKENNFENVVISIKSSNPTIMVQANRLLVAEMKKKKFQYPIHLGVTEAGNKRDGRIKSAVGIGALLVDGIGDTIRVSLTEKPENEIPVALKIVEHIEKRKNQEKIEEINNVFFNPYSFERRKTYQVENIGGHKQPIVIADFCDSEITFDDFMPDFVKAHSDQAGDLMMTEVRHITPFSEWHEDSSSIPILDSEQYLKFENNEQFVFVELTYKDLNKKLLSKVHKNQNVVFIVKNHGDNIIGEYRLLYSILEQNKCKAPVILKFQYHESDIERFYIQASIDSSVFLIDGLADGIMLCNSKIDDIAEIVDISFDILQAAHRRLSKTEFISCPSCGRTLFDLEEVTEKVKKKTKHLKGLKIAIMGCIVNGPGEVADADYGYIGAGNNKVTLFKGKKPVKKNIDEHSAVDELVNLIKENGDWIEP